MMMSKPTDETKEESAPPAFATAAPPPTSLKVGSVEDLERKLKMLSSTDGETKPPAVTAPAVTAAPPATSTAAASAAAVKGGKNALLARIMAAKEKSQQSKTVASPAPAPPVQVMSSNPTVDLLGDFDAPSTANVPPPSYDTNFLAGVPPPAAPVADADAAAAPPAFDAVENTVMQQVNDSNPPPPSIDDVFMPPPPPAQDVVAPPAAPAASAPSFEDLLGGGGNNTQQQQREFHPPPVPPPAQLDIDESILNALEPAEREAFLEEQRKIMEQIEKEKVGNEASGAAARAAAFDQRSTAAVANVAASYDTSSSSRSRPAASSSSRSSTAPSASASSRGTVNLGEGAEVPLHGQEKTQQAIKDGTALIVQCLSCNNWMQVTGEAEVMMCPLCNTITRVERAGAATTADMEAAAQMAADAELAEKLQKEEYARASGGNRSRSRQAASPSSSSQRQAQSSSSPGQEQGWMDWIMGVPAPAPATSAAIASGAHSAEIRPQAGLVSAQTGEERRGGGGPSPSFGGGGGGARVAEQKSMFSCVADAVGTAATQMSAYSLPQDDEGNYHGVDGSSLLAMPNEDVSRQRE